MAESDEEKLDRDEDPEPDNDVNPPDFDHVDREVGPTPEDVDEDVEPPKFTESLP